MLLNKMRMQFRVFLNDYFAFTGNLSSANSWNGTDFLKELQNIGMALGFLKLQPNSPEILRGKAL